MENFVIEYTTYVQGGRLTAVKLSVYQYENDEFSGRKSEDFLHEKGNGEEYNEKC